MSAKIAWRRHVIGNSTRWHLYINDSEQPWFIDRNGYDRVAEFRYRVLGSGMSPLGSARDFAWCRTLAEAKSRAVTLADAGATKAGRITIGNRTVLIGDTVTPTDRPTGFFYSEARVGKIVGLTSGLNCWVKWSGDDLSSPFRLDLLRRLDEDMAA